MMATPSDQGENEQEHLPPGDEVQNNMVEVESTRHRRRCLLLVAIVVLCFIVIGGGVSVLFVLLLINQSGSNTNTQIDTTSKSTINPPKETSTLPTTEIPRYSLREWSPWSQCIRMNTTCGLELSKRERSCRRREKSARRHVSRDTLTHSCQELSLEETRMCPFVRRQCTDCAEIKGSLRGSCSNGTYIIDPDGQGPFQVYCDMTTDGGGWTVFQRRQDGSVEFNRTWDEYKTGFGNLSGEFWLGNEYIHRLTFKRNMTLRADFAENHYYHYRAIYDNVSISSERYNYTLNVGSFREGRTSSLKWRENKQQFSTADRDNDQRSDKNYAADIGGGWWYPNWYRYSHRSPNGIYGKTFGWYSSSFGSLEYCIFKIK